MTEIDWSYDAWPSGEPYEWMGAARTSQYDAIDFHVDLGCGKVKKGRIGIDQFPAPGVNIVMDLDKLEVYAKAQEPGWDAVRTIEFQGNEVEVWCGGGDGKNHDGVYGQHYKPGDLRRLLGRGLPFADSSIESIISHHCMEHIGDGFIALVDEVWRVLKPGGVFRAITPLFPSRTAMEDPTHRRYFVEGTWDYMLASPEGANWQESFAVPAFRSRWEMLDKDVTAPLEPEDMWGPDDAREIRVALGAIK